jgi:hypothetical protein
MKKVLFLTLIALFAAGMAFAQVVGGAGDILGPHNVDGHGCASCHAPHNGAAGNVTGGDAATGSTYLWGRGLIATTYATFGGASMVTKSAYAESDAQFHTAACLSCHDGSIKPAGMNGTTFEKTLDGAQPNTYLNSDSLANDHPVDVVFNDKGLSSYDWPGTVDVNGKFTFTATTPAFDYGHPIRLYGTTANGGQAMVECSTCHNPHAMNMAKVTLGSGSKANKPTAFFIRGWYDDGNTASNSTQQFCRNCHYSKSNEYVGMSVPTT